MTVVKRLIYRWQNFSFFLWLELREELRSISATKKWGWAPVVHSLRLGNPCWAEPQLYTSFVQEPLLILNFVRKVSVFLMGSQSKHLFNGPILFNAPLDLVLKMSFSLLGAGRFVWFVRRNNAPPYVSHKSCDSSRENMRACKPVSFFPLLYVQQQRRALLFKLFAPTQSSSMQQQRTKATLG